MEITYSKSDITRLILSNPRALATFMSYFDGDATWIRGDKDISDQITEPQIKMALCMTLGSVDDRLPVENREFTEDVIFDFEDEDWTLSTVWETAGGFALD